MPLEKRDNFTFFVGKGSGRSSLDNGLSALSIDVPRGEEGGEEGIPAGRKSSTGPLKIARNASRRKERESLMELPAGTETMSLNDFVLKHSLGCGLTGNVLKARRFSNTSPCAIKVMRKAELVRLQQVDHAINEKETLERLNSPFTVNLTGSFQDDKALYLVMEYVEGGDLFELISKTGVLPINASRFYVMQVLLALDHLHSRGYVYRDLKPENVLITKSGNVKLADMGFTKLIFEKGRAHTVCGTVDYIAPEILEHRGCGLAADFWGLGVLIFELISGCPPFRGKTRQELCANIVKGEITYWPANFPPRAKALVRALLCYDESERLGMREGGIQEVKDHPWFEGIDWETALRCLYDPPFVPDLEQDSAEGRSDLDMAGGPDVSRNVDKLRQLMEKDQVAPAEEEKFADF
mmetsp:Transcript_34788/g.109853  ORF Transcript_34788/g.109853 Transcript_34788/m.109853 type:complete len:410 (-) Transcript_34788:98-1327(-)|eukprot:CAMPEP_0182895358 /NCGR_PEP_ID=MMETSP0034_2-20130328/25633_1 /TAXON_ID=156128 /ORGANISM="Nephroselmis pyriformis, Strain CCMP717" /LENGTH=409 /DNA_ID=CAMNT_0025029183 /DNA_START=191 /DNA_END=1420 /DNA_ORIENTATION=+